MKRTSTPVSRETLGVVGTRGLALVLTLAVLVSGLAADAHETPEDVVMPEPASGQPVTLGQLSAWADRHGPAVRLATQESQLGEAEIEGARQLFPENPTVDAGAGARVEGATVTLDLDVGLEQTFEIAGQRGLRIRAAERVRDVQVARVDQQRWDVRAEVHRGFHELLLADQRVTAAESLEAFANTLLSIAERIVAAGQEAPVVLLVARAEVAEARKRRITAIQTREEARLSLMEVVGWPVAHPLNLDATPLAVLRPLPVDELVALALENHPALRTSALEIDAARARLALEDREAWPDPAVGFNYEETIEGGEDVNVWLATLTVPLPFWDRNQGERARAAVELRSAQLHDEVLTQRLRVRVRRASTAVNGAADRIEIYGRDIAPAFRKNLDLVERAFQAGEIDIFRVTQMRERVLKTQQDAIEAHSDYIEAAARLEGLVGTDRWFVSPQ
jgi:cobalt-zinc-cadmium efflux system outer membrane protein